MEKAEKYRKLCKIVQYGGMALIVIIGMIVIYFTTIKNGNGDTTASLTYIMGVIIVLFTFMILVGVPMNNHLLRIVIVESLNGLVTDLKFQKKKGFTKETFESFNVATDKAEDYLCNDYYSFKYNDQPMESCTINYSTTTKLPRKDKPKKLQKVNIKYFFGRVYVIPFDNKDGIEFKVLAKPQASASKAKVMATTSTPNILPCKVKKYNEAFEVFYGEEKPTMNVQGFLEKLYYLKLQAKGNISAVIRKKTIVLCIDNNHYYADIDIKDKLNDNLIRDYRKDVSMVLSFVNSLNKED